MFIPFFLLGKQGVFLVQCHSEQRNGRQAAAFKLTNWASSTFCSKSRSSVCFARLSSKSSRLSFSTCFLSSSACTSSFCSISWRLFCWDQDNSLIFANCYHNMRVQLKENCTPQRLLISQLKCPEIKAASVQVFPQIPSSNSTDCSFEDRGLQTLFQGQDVAHSQILTGSWPRKVSASSTKHDWNSLLCIFSQVF